jgi:arsenate reductase (thioredoxin)
MNKQVLLVLCTGNTCRSQMAAALLRAHHGDQYEVHSAGMEPRNEVHPLAVRAMAEIGFDISREVPKSVREFLGRVPVRHLLIVCNKANASCPRIWPGAYTRDYLPFDDPAEAQGSEEERLAVFRRVRDEIGAAMKLWQPGVEGSK